jgi:GT2 family glycosyltransferase
MRFALRHTSAEFVWLLNNDTVVDTGSLTAQIATITSDPSVGIVGSTIVYFDQPAVVQCFGGFGFNFWNGRVRPLPFTASISAVPPASEVDPLLRYISGASMFLTRRFLEDVGPMNEQYFLYFEEIDWAVRAERFRIAFCPTSVVYHKEGSSIGSNRDASARSFKSELWLSRNRVLFTRTYFPVRAFLVVLWMLFVIAVRLVQGERGLAKAMWRGMDDGIRAPKKTLSQISQWPA